MFIKVLLFHHRPGLQEVSTSQLLRTHQECCTTREREPTKDRTDIIHTFEEAPSNCTLAVLDVSEVVLFIWCINENSSALRLHALYLWTWKMIVIVDSNHYESQIGANK